MWLCRFFFFQAEDGIRDLVRSRGLGDVYKRQEVLLERFAALLREREADPDRQREVGEDDSPVEKLSLIHI